MRNLMAGLAALAVLAAPVSAQQSIDVAMAGNERAEALGRQIYLHDQAAWHATDALAAEIEFADHPELRGYVVDPLDNGNLGLVFYAEDDDGLFEFARYEVAESTVIGGGRHGDGERIALSPLLSRLVAARNTAIEEAVSREWNLCTGSSANFVALPPDETGVIAAYILTSTEEAGIYPFGGHYRVDVGLDGDVVATRQFTNSCLNMGVAAGPEGQTPGALGVSHILDDHPTEIHYFQSNYVPIQVFVITGNKTWVIEKGEFRKITE